MRALRLLLSGLCLMLSACEDDETDDYLLNYESQQTLLCVSSVQNQAGVPAAFAQCKFAPAFEQPRCPGAGERVSVGGSELWTVRVALYAAWVDGWEACWAQVEACHQRRDCPDAWTVSSGTQRLGWDGGLAL